ncbi:MAG: hypothetical protein HY057_00600 [Rhodospirillales bacterium]|nr:hypothetical protein [Rhodospirillales bacterium]
MRISMPILAAVAAAMAFASPADAAPKRVKVTGEIIDTWCQVTGIMYGLGTAHHQCAVWCATGGIPVGIWGDDEKAYVLLKIDADSNTVANPKIVEIQTNRVTVDGDLYERDGVNYLVVTKVLSNEGIVNLTHKEHGIQPFGE